MRRRFLPAVFLLLALAPFAGMLAKKEVPFFRDHATYFLPLRWHTAHALASGDLPLWNPYNGLGEQWAANPQTAVFYPPAWIFLALPFETAYVVFLWLHLALLGASAYALFRRWAPEVPSAFGAIALMFSGPTLSLLDIGNNLTSFAWIPLVIRLALERSADRSRPAAAIGAALAMMFFGGEPLYAAIGALVVAVALAGSRDWTGLAKSALWAISLSAVQLFPFLAWIRASDRSAGLDPADAFRHAMAAGDWIALAFSTATPGGTYVPLRVEQTFLPSLYVGVPVVLLALGAGLGSLRSEDSERRRTIAILVLAFAAVLVLAAAPRFDVAREWLLVFRFNAIRYPARLVPIGALLIAALAAIGLDRVRKEPLTWRLGVTLWVALLGGIHFLAVEPLGRPVTLHRFAIFLGWVVLFGLAYVLVPRLLADRRVALVVVAVLSADLLWSARPLLAHRPLVREFSGWSSRLDPPWRFVNVAATEAQGRVQRADLWLLGYQNLYERRFDFATPAPVVPSRFLSFFSTATHGDRDDLVDLASVRWVLSTRAKLRRGYVRTDSEKKGVTLFDNRGAFPPLQFWAGAAAPGAGDPLGRLLAREFDARRRIEVRPPPSIAVTGAARRVTVPSRIRFDGSSAAVDVVAPSAGVVVLTQLAAEGWRVEVDGAPARALVVDGLFRGVEIREGAHEVRWIYRPLSLQLGGGITVLALVLLALGRWRPRKRSARRLDAPMSA